MLGSSLQKKQKAYVQTCLTTSNLATTTKIAVGFASSLAMFHLAGIPSTIFDQEQRSNVGERDADACKYLYEKNVYLDEHETKACFFLDDPTFFC